MKNQNSDLLEQIQIASPCKVAWSSMTGSERMRYCGKCKLHVYNLSEMSRVEAEQFLADSSGRTCVRFFKRFDGTVMTNDCRGKISDAFFKVRIFALVSSVIAYFLGWYIQITQSACSMGIVGGISKR